MRVFAIILFIAPSLALAQEGDELALVRNLFAQINPQSISENTEYCGYIGYTADGTLAASKPTRGELDSCMGEDDGLDVVASYHTHGAWSPDYASEVPSGEDMEGDADEGIDGWLATPGGRLWYIDTNDMIASQICGAGCLPSDPKYSASGDGIIQISYSYDDLVTYLEAE